ncbi:phage tail protein [Achromobacter marplatensis]|nr:phage tail protein [Achromobacter marplatensis]
MKEQADTAPAAGTPGWATDGNPATNKPATQWPAYAFNAMQEELTGVIQGSGLVLNRSDNTLLLKAIQKMIAAALENRPPIFSITTLPAQDIGPIIVAECEEVWRWSASAYFNGYRSSLCGRPLDGHTAVPLISEVDAIGGLLSKASYARLWGYAKENALVVTQTVWDANRGAHYFVDVNSTQFRTPDLRNMFRRFSGTDVDSANARALGSKQADALQQISGQLQLRPDDTGSAPILNTPSGAFNVVTAAGSTGAARMVSNASPLTQNTVSFDASRVARTSTETRPANAAYHPRIHV